MVEICRRLDGIQLAIKLAAARIKALVGRGDCPAAERRDSSASSRAVSRTAMPRQQTLQALIDWSWELLADPEKVLLRRLAVFAGGWTLQAAAAFTRSPDQLWVRSIWQADTLDGLGQLIDRSLVLVDRRGSTRYGLLETIRQYAIERLAISGEAPVLRHDTWRTFSTWPVEAVPQLRGPRRSRMVGAARRRGRQSSLGPGLGSSRPTSEARRTSGPAVALNWYWRSRSVGSESLEFLARASKPGSAAPPTGSRSKGPVSATSFLSGLFCGGFPYREPGAGGPRRSVRAEEAFAFARQVDDPETWTGDPRGAECRLKPSRNVERFPEL